MDDPWLILREGAGLMKGKLVRYTFILFLCGLIGALLNTLVSTEQMMNQPQWLLPYVAAAMGLIVLRNTVYILFIKRVRKEVFQKEDILYSLHKVGLHIATALLFEILQLGLSYGLVLISQLMPILSLPVGILLQAAISAVSVFIAFAIYDGAKGAMMIVNGSFRLMWKKARALIIMAMPLIIWILVYQMMNHAILNRIEWNLSQVSWDVLQSALTAASTQGAAYAYIALEIGNALMIALIQYVLFAGYAFVYEQNYTQYYPFSMTIPVGVIQSEKIQESGDSSTAEKEQEDALTAHGQDEENR